MATGSKWGEDDDAWVPKPGDPIGDIKRLAAHVIEQAIADATIPDDAEHVIGTGIAPEHVRHAAGCWFASDSHGCCPETGMTFGWCCDVFELDLDRAREWAIRRIKRGRIYRLDRRTAAVVRRSR